MVERERLLYSKERLPQLWRMTCPKICGVSQQTGNHASRWCRSRVPVQRLAGLKPRENHRFSSSPNAGNALISQLHAGRQREAPSYSLEGQLLVLFPPSADCTGPDWGEQSALPNLLIQTLISSKNSPRDMPRIKYDQV